MNPSFENKWEKKLVSNSERYHFIRTKKRQTMELKIKIEYQELLNLIWQLPIDQLTRLRGDIMEKRRPQKMEHKSFQAFLLNGPIMDDDQFESFQANRTHFSQWRSN